MRPLPEKHYQLRHLCPLPNSLPYGLKVLPKLLKVNVPVHVGVNVLHDVLQLPVLPEDVDCDHGEDGEDEEAVHDGEASRQVVQGFPGPGSQTEDNRQM